VTGGGDLDGNGLDGGGLDGGGRPPQRRAAGRGGAVRPARPAPARSFDPNRVGGRECRAWAAYYRKEWATLLVVSVGLVHAGFRMSWRRTLRGAWLVLRANQLWAPYPDNDPAGARRCMERFYRLVAADSGEALDCAEAARREVEWWRVHRQVQRGQSGDAAAHREALVDALVALYSFVYGADPEAVRPAAAFRAEAMDLSDRWVEEGCDMDSPVLAEERAALVRSFASLLAAVHRVPG
jgi:hypothetical protein